MQKQPYSRLLDAEFLNAGGRERVRVLNRGASRVLSSWAPCPSCSHALLHIGLLFAVLLSALLTLIVYLSAVPTNDNPDMFLVYSEHNKVPPASPTEAAHALALAPAPVLPLPQLRKADLIKLAAKDPALLRQIQNIDVPGWLNRLYGGDHHRSSENGGEELDDDHQHDDSHTDNHVQHEHGEEHNESHKNRHPHLEEHEHLADILDHHIALGGGLTVLHDGHFKHDGEHAHDGDVVLEDHHIVAAGSETGEEAPRGPKGPALLVCDRVAEFVKTRPAPASAAPAGNASLFLSRTQQDVVYSTMEYLGAGFKCHVVILDSGAALTPPAAQHGNATNNATIAPPRSTAASGTTPPQLPLRDKPLSPSNVTLPDRGSSDDTSESLRDEDYLILANGRRVGLVHQDGDQLFRRSPLSGSWRHLQLHGLLALAGRLQLLWQCGGISVDLQSSTDQALKTLSMVNRSDTTHVYLETTHGTVLSSPRTCNAMVFDLIETISKEIQAGSEASKITTGHPDPDLKVFDGVLNTYCRSPSPPPPGPPARRSARAALPPPDQVLRQHNTEAPSQSSEARLNRTLCRGDLIALSFV